MDIITASELMKEFGTITAVDGISFSVKKGETFGFLGPNGAGKTTSMRMIQCVSPRTSGDLQIFSMDPDRSARSIRARIGVVPQETNLDTELTVIQNLTLFAGYYGISRRSAEVLANELLDSFQLSSKRDVNVDLLSGGMKRRLLLARALMNTPELLILDEPTIGLDPQARHDLWERLIHLKNIGKTIVLTTHYLDEAARLCDRLVIMDNGKILVEGNPQVLVDTYIGMDIVETDRTEATIRILDTYGIEYETWGEQIRIRTLHPRRIMDTLMNENLSVRVTSRPASLEDVFLMLTGRSLRD